MSLAHEMELYLLNSNLAEEEERERLVKCLPKGYQNDNTPYWLMHGRAAKMKAAIMLTKASD